jgi:hypothetical protein
MENMKMQLMVSFTSTYTSPEPGLHNFSLFATVILSPACELSKLLSHPLVLVICIDAAENRNQLY